LRARPDLEEVEVRVAGEEADADEVQVTKLNSLKSCVGVPRSFV
jgi:hypothetical protein